VALIILEPGEVFEHYHATTSGTELRRGAVRCRYGTTQIDLRPGQVIAIPAAVPHEWKTLGRYAHVWLAITSRLQATTL
jgi:mannose-6-phosphate isomerase-like protein (cupin superfamily)